MKQDKKKLYIHWLISMVDCIFFVLQCLTIFFVCLQIESPEFPEDLKHWISFISASSQALRAESGLEEKNKWNHDIFHDCRSTYHSHSTHIYNIHTWTHWNIVEVLSWLKKFHVSLVSHVFGSILPAVYFCVLWTHSELGTAEYKNLKCKIFCVL